MLKKEIRPVCEALKKIRMPKLSNKDIRNALIHNHLFLLGQLKKFNEAVEDLRTVHLGPFDAELQEIGKMQAALNTERDGEKRKELVDKINSHADAFAAIGAFNKAIADIENEPIEIESIDGAAFVEDYGNTEDYDGAIVEALFPMFK